MHFPKSTCYTQEGKAQRRGVCFIAISSNILTHAAVEGRNIWREVEDGRCDVIGMGPEMIQTTPVAHLLQSKKFCQRLGFMVIDEVHLVDKWGHTFRKDFLQLTELRSCVKTHVTFLGMSASLHDNNRQRVQQLLGFAVKLTIDQTDLMYCPCFLTWSAEGPTFPNLAWTLPAVMHGPDDLPRILFTCNTIKKVTVLCRWLVTELKHCLYCGGDSTDQDVEQMVLRFHSLIDDCD